MLLWFYCLFLSCNSVSDYPHKTVTGHPFLFLTRTTSELHRLPDGSMTAQHVWNTSNSLTNRPRGTSIDGMFQNASRTHNLYGPRISKKQQLLLTLEELVHCLLEPHAYYRIIHYNQHSVARPCCLLHSSIVRADLNALAKQEVWPLLSMSLLLRLGCPH